MNISEYVAKIFEPKFIPQQALKKQSKNAIEKTLSELNQKLNSAIGKFAGIKDHLWNLTDISDQPEVITQVRKEFERALRDILPYKKRCQPDYLSRGFNSVGILYQAESNHVRKLLKKEAQNTGVEEKELQDSDVMYVDCACLKGTIESLEAALEYNPNKNLRKDLNADLFKSKQRFLSACLGLLLFESCAALSPFKIANSSNTESEALLPASETVDITEDADPNILALVEHIRLIAELLGLMKARLESSTSMVDNLSHYQDNLMNLIRLHSLGLAHQFFEASFTGHAESGVKQLLTDKEWHSKIFKLCIDTADTLAYLLEHDCEGNPRSPKLSSEPQEFLTLFIEYDLPPEAAPSSVDLVSAESSLTDPLGKGLDSQHQEAPFETDTTHSPAGPSRVHQKLSALIEKRPFTMTDFYTKHLGEHLPESVLYATEQECKEAEMLILRLKNVSFEEQLAPELAAEVSEKISELEARIRKARSADFRNDLLKSYKFPQAAHWAELMKNGQVSGVDLNPKALGTEGKKFYEIRIVSTPRQVDGKPQVAWLHIHVNSAFPENYKKVRIWKELKEMPHKITAAHLKSDFFRTKGKEWEKEQEISGRFDSLVKRSKANMALYQELDRFILTAPTNGAASTSSR